LHRALLDTENKKFATLERVENCVSQSDTSIKTPSPRRGGVLTWEQQYLLQKLDFSRIYLFVRIAVKK